MLWLSVLVCDCVIGSVCVIVCARVCATVCECCGCVFMHVRVGGWLCLL